MGTVAAVANLSETYVPAISPETKHLLVQIHATAFTFAWFFLIVVAATSARYLRQLCPNYRPFGLLLWFHLHRTLNVIALFLMFIGLITVFVAYEWTWKGPTINGTKNWSPGSLHTFFGVVACVLAFGQPLNAFFRCSPTHPKRPFFDVFHRMSGTTAWVSGAIALGIACRLFQKRLLSTTASFFLYLLELFVVFSFVAALEYWTSLEKKQKRISENGKNPNRRLVAIPRFSCAAVGALAFVTFVVTTSICLLVWMK